MGSVNLPTGLGPMKGLALSTLAKSSRAQLGPVAAVSAGALEAAASVLVVFVGPLQLASRPRASVALPASERARRFRICMQGWELRIRRMQRTLQ
nr:hypothetical protein [Tanacetum cinerariifolium]